MNIDESDAVDLPQWVRILRTATQALSHALEDKLHAESGREILYNVDFSILYPFLFESGGDFRRPMIETSDKMKWILQSESSSGVPSLVITGATFLEMIDMLNHRVESLHQLRAKIVGSQEFERDLLMQDSKELADGLQLLSREGVERHILAPVERLRDLMGKGLVTGVGDKLRSDRVDEARLRETFQRLLNTQVRERRGDLRPDNDVLFHYKIDAANVALSLTRQLEHEPGVLFLTTSGQNLRMCRTGPDNVGRYVFVPLYLRNTRALREQGFIKNESAFLKDALESSIDLLGDLEDSAADATEDLSPYLRMKLLSHSNLYMTHLHQIGETPPQNVQEQQQQLHELLKGKSREQLVSRVSEHLSLASQQIGELYEEARVLDSTFSDVFDLESDPVVQRMKKSLELS